MNRLLILFIITFTSCSNISAQKYTNIYIRDANNVALKWLNNINHQQYGKCYHLLDEVIKAKYDSTVWCGLIVELMQEFGTLNSRVVINKFFTSELENQEDGFYVFVEYNSDYENTKEHKEYLILKQNDQTKWKILDYNYEFKALKEEE